MLKKCLSLVLIGLLVNLIDLGPALAFTGAGDKSPVPVEEIKEKIAKRGTGKKARVTVTLQDGTKVKGYVSQAAEDSFVVADSKTGQTTIVAYRDVAQVKGKGLSTAAKIGIGVAIGVGATAAILAIAVKTTDFPRVF